MPEIIEHEKYKYKTYDNIPGANELIEYYTKKYFQNNVNYAYRMDPLEIEFKHAQARFLLDVLSCFFDQSLSHIVEVGAGEGFFLANAIKRGLSCHGLDYNTEQLLDEHAFCKDVFVASIDPIADVCKLNPPPSCVVLRHVIEHVPDPVATVRELSRVLSKGSLLVMEAPHDFKPLQSKIFSESLSSREYWLNYPDHLSYFSPAQLGHLLSDHKFVIRECYGDYPIELLLLSDYFNYQLNKEVGRHAHLLRCAISSYLYENTPFIELLELYRAYSKCKIGRSFTIIAEKT